MFEMDLIKEKLYWLKYKDTNTENNLIELALNESVQNRRDYLKAAQVYLRCLQI